MEQLDIDSLRAAAIAGCGPPVRLIDVRRAIIHRAVAPVGTEALVRAQGSRTERIKTAACDLVDAAKPFTSTHAVPAGAVRVAGNVRAPEIP